MDDQRMADALIWPNPAEAGAPLQFMAGALDVQILATDGRLMAQGAHAALSAPSVPGLYVAQWSIDGRYFRTKLVVR
jgi:hypothetical protein